MKSVDNIRNKLIDKILSINNEDFLKALDEVITSISGESQVIALSQEQKIMLELSEQDIVNGRLVSQDAMMKRNTEWLNAM